MIARTVSLLSNGMCQAGTTTVKKGSSTPTLWALLWILTVSSSFRVIFPRLSSRWTEGGPVESNERYYRRRAVEERMAAQRAVTEQARAWHAKLAEDFAARAINCTTAIISQTAVSA